MTRYFKNKNSNSYFVTNSEIELTSDWEEITKEQYEEMSSTEEQETQEEL